MAEKRVVITGIGTVTATGKNKDEFWSNIKAGKHGISQIESFDVSESDVKLAAEIKNFDPAEYGIEKKRQDALTAFVSLPWRRQIPQ